MTQVLFSDLKAAYREIQGEIDNAIARVVSSGWYIGGPEVAAFEEAFADYCDADHCVGVGNGLDALHLALLAMGVGRGDEVIVASNSYIATVLAVSMAGATPVFVEPDPRTFNIDPARIEEAITPRTKALLPTHLYGQPADLDPMLELAHKHGLKLLEDAAQAHGARYKGRRIGAHGDAVAWSFYPTKNLGALGDGGALTTRDPEIARRVRQLGNYGFATRYVADVKGVNSRLDPLQAAILAVKLNHLDSWNDRRRAVANRYDELLDGCVIETPHVPDWAEPVWHLFVVKSDERDVLARRLDAGGVQNLVHYPIPPHRQKAYDQMRLGPGSFPIAEQLADRVLSIPIGPHMNDSEVQRVAACIREIAFS